MSETRHFTRSIGILLLGVVMLNAGGCGGDGATTVSSGNDCSSAKTCPTADAGTANQTVLVGSLVTLDGSASQANPNNPGLLSYQWTLTTKPAGSTATLTGGTTVRPTFMPDLAGTYVVSLTVSVGTATSAADQVVVTAVVGNAPPVANAGPDQNVTTGQLVTLNGSGSTDANGDPLTYNWSLTSKPAGSAAALTNATNVRPTFTVDLAGAYVISLTVSDGTATSAADQVVVTAVVGNAPPVANAGPDQNVTTGQLVTLNGSGSTDANGDPLTYNWSLTSKPAGSAAALNNPTTATPTFTSDFVGSYVLVLVVNDGQVDSQPDTVVIDASLPSFVNGVLQAYAKASNTGASDQFGRSVALSGGTLAVGAPLEDSCTDGVNGDQTNNVCDNAGAVYVFTRSSGVWNQEAYVKASISEALDEFGHSVALAGDTLAVGAHFEDSCATGIDGNQADNSCQDAGAVYVYTRTAGLWSQQAYVKASISEALDNFGQSVALSGDTLAVGAISEASCATGIGGDQTNNGCGDAGAVYVYTRTAGLWSQQAYVKASNTGAGDWFGTSVALAGDTLAVGALHEDSCATGIDGDQTNNGCGDAGAVYVYTRTAGLWSQQAYVKASNTGIGDQLGQGVALAGDTLAVGALLEDSCATGIDGNQADNSCQDAGAVYVYTRTASLWSQQAYVKASNTGAGDWFGTSVALAGDTLAVGALHEDSCATGIDGDQTNNGCGDAGAVYVYTRTAGLWSQQAYVKASNTGIGDQLGLNVALAGDTLAVGALLEDSNATGINGDQTNNSAVDSGAGYVYEAQ